MSVLLRSNGFGLAESRSVGSARRGVVIPARGLFNDKWTGPARFTATVDGIKLLLRTCSNSGN